MPQATGLGVALRKLRERRKLSLREVSTLAGVDHAYIHRLESGEKVNPSDDLLRKLRRVLKPTERDAAIVEWLALHPDADSHLVEFVLDDANVSFDIFTAAAGVRYRGPTRPDPATLIARVKRAFEDE
jgi:HTH-type transcriptional regulator, competence development regulator